MKDVSVIIPTFKRVTQTLKTIGCILNSVGKNKQFKLEIIVSDSSPDNLLQDAIKNEYGKKIIYVRPQSPGVSTGKNKGAQVANGKFIIFCDSDIELESDTIIQLLNTLNSPTVAAVTGRVIWKGGEKDKQVDIPQKADRIIKIGNVSYIESIYSRYLATYKKLFWDVGGYDETVFNMRGEGADLSIRYWKMGFPLAINTSITAYHIFNAPDSIALRTQNPQWAIAKDLLLLALKYDLLEGNSPNFSHTLNNIFSQYGEYSHYNILQGIGKNLDFITQVKPIIDKQKQNMKIRYAFKFLEVFSDDKLFKECIQNASKILNSLKK